MLPQTARMGRRARSLSDGEEVVIRLRPHGRALVLPAVALLAVMGVGGFLAARVPPGAARLAVVTAGVALLVRLCLVPWLRWLSTTLVVTDRRVQLRSGVLRTTTRDVPLGRIADVGVSRSLGQRLVGSGTLVLATGERGVVTVPDVPGVHDVARTVGDLLAELHDDGELAYR